MNVATRVSLVFGRAAVIGLGLILGVSIGVAAYRYVRPPAAPLMAAPRHVAAPRAGARSSIARRPWRSRPPPPLTSAGVAPAAIWLVEKGPGGSSTATACASTPRCTVKGTPRAYRVFDGEGSLEARVYDAPVGLLFHTSESDVWPLEAAYNENLRDSLAGPAALRAAQPALPLRDRPLRPRVPRSWPKRRKANHAGNSVWANDGRVYLNLNHAFLGVSFETRWEGGKALPITQAQLAAGRNLSDYLRQRYEIAPEMCVTHGLTSVNPKKHLIGHHMDWARGFPFEAFGLPDQYQRAAPSVALFGFGYDDDFLKVLDQPWPGVRDGGGGAGARGRAAGIATSRTCATRRQSAYDRWMAKQQAGRTRKRRTHLRLPARRRGAASRP